MNCSCPNTNPLVSISASDCEIHLRQLQRVVFQRAGYEFDASATIPLDITDLAIWQALKTATDSTKVVSTPFIGSDPKIEAGEAITAGGGDNTTLNGIEEIMGSNPSKFSTVFYGLTPQQESDMKKLMCEKNLVAFFINEEDKIIARKTGTGKYKGIPIQSLFMSDRNNAGFGTKDTNTLRFSLKEGWSEDIELVTTTWSPLTEL